MPGRCPAIARWSRSSGWRRRESAARISAEPLRADPERLRAEMGELLVGLLRGEQPDAGALLRACLGEHELAAALEAEPERGRLRALLAGAQVAQAAGGHQVHHQHELAVVGLEQEPLAASRPRPRAAGPRAPRAAGRSSSASPRAPARRARSGTRARARRAHRRTASTSGSSGMAEGYVGVLVSRRPRETRRPPDGLGATGRGSSIFRAEVVRGVLRRRSAAMWPPLFHPPPGGASATTRRGASVKTRTPAPWAGYGSSAQAPCRRDRSQKPYC